MIRLAMMAGLLAIVMLSTLGLASATVEMSEPPNEEARAELERRGPPLGSGTYIQYVCSPPSNPCNYEYTLSPWDTKEFRGACRSGSNNVAPANQWCNGGGMVTCTITWPLNDYKSCSCTNWSVDHHETAKVEVWCPAN